MNNNQRAKLRKVERVLNKEDEYSSMALTVIEYTDGSGYIKYSGLDSWNDPVIRRLGDFESQEELDGIIDKLYDKYANKENK